ncbi:hypothetical protein ABL78_0210 [Leptomonas seymouri]|uniref:Uncharacterized protein n=1 Tax=Leptomonas seymouri TaxID=5684 RepID=A0A0N1IC93_LEPSE|nr:hypothetical protein ABL78_0210 [Leptomonas seymouri]|eukprot:KPI90614.1 hypothetical protein ABL78_0210 [Leptomonas seymouri]
MSPRVTAALVLLPALSFGLRTCTAADTTPMPTMYVRRTYPIEVPFFTKYWWVGFVVMFLVFLLIVLALGIAVRYHFKEADQHRRKTEIEVKRSTHVSDSDEEVRSVHLGNEPQPNGRDPLDASRT